ncbi:hypothetical protein [Caulobacter sp. 17J80-11]|uniref:hypothetical protein n=1 Tax=Caulobacter sp. 17J80-11 TaxID=2763502 RepID=UPI0016537507|nr:hypothetical protein [Caulobacter sp. 17J80-11]MBC6980349.1 hypothetical protein [Caulobacter sp. 17J80-11]
MRVDVVRAPTGWRINVNGRPVTLCDDKAKAVEKAARIATVLRACDMSVDYSVRD